VSLTGTPPEGADIIITDSGGKKYYYNPTTKVLYEKKSTVTYSGSHANYYPVTGTLKQDLLIANLSKIPGAETGEVKYQSLAVSPKSTAFRYPHDMLLGEESDYVLFDFYEYTPPFSSEVDLPEVARPINWKLANYNNSVTQSAKAAEGFNQLLLYMPDDVQDQYRADWEGKAFGTMTAGILASAGRAGTIAKLEQLANTGKTTLKNLKVNAAASLVSGLAQSITGDNITPQDVFASVGGAIRNPNVELLFQSMNLRTFDLTFKMSPYDTTDEKNVRGIINTFRKAMLPKYEGVTSVFDIKNDGVQAAFIKVPNLCKVAYMRGASTHPHLPSYKLCAITDMNVNYTPDNNYSTFAGGGPVAYELKVSFMETKLVFAEDFGEGRMT
jgi:hypothetical protein